MKSLYTREIANFVRTRDWPVEGLFTVTEKYEPQQHLMLLFHRNVWLTMDFAQQLKAHAVTKEVVEKLWSEEVPVYVGKIDNPSVVN